MKLIEWCISGLGLCVVIAIAICGFVMLALKLAFFELIYLWIVLLFAHVIYEIWRW